MRDVPSTKCSSTFAVSSASNSWFCKALLITENRSERGLKRRIVEQNSRHGIVVFIFIVAVARLCPFRPWLTLIFCTKMADVTLDAFDLHSSKVFSHSANASSDGNIHMVPFYHI